MLQWKGNTCDADTMNACLSVAGLWPCHSDCQAQVSAVIQTQRATSKQAQAPWICILVCNHLCHYQTQDFTWCQIQLECEWTFLCAGYGNTWPNQCWLSAWSLIVHQVFGMILNAITVGVIFSRVSFPQQRGRTIAISDSAVIARRDGILKFMFRIADIRQSQVRVLAKLYCETSKPPMGPDM